MKKLFAWTMAAVLLVSLAALPGYGQTAQDVLKKIIDAQGGRKYLETIKDSTSSGTMELTAMGMSGTFTIYQKEPNKYRMDMDLMGMTITQAYDGQKGWYTNPQSGNAVEEMPEAQSKEFARQAMGNDYLLNPQKYGVTYALKPSVKLENKDYIVLEQTTADGKKTTLYIDPSTYLTYKVELITLGQAGTEVKMEVYSSDYKKIGQSLVPHSQRIVQDGAEFAKMVVSKVTFNDKLEDSLFAMNK
jgi:outer membrane lipoprotein-sorting protein